MGTKPITIVRFNDDDRPTSNDQNKPDSSIIEQLRNQVNETVNTPVGIDGSCIGFNGTNAVQPTFGSRFRKSPPKSKWQMLVANWKEAFEKFGKTLFG